MFKFIWNSFGVVGLLFILTLAINPQIVPGTVTIAKSYVVRGVNLVELVWEEWK